MYMYIYIYIPIYLFIHTQRENPRSNIHYLIRNTCDLISDL